MFCLRSASKQLQYRADLTVPALFTAPALLGENGCDTKLFDLAKSVHWVVDVSADGKRKRRSGLGAEDSEDEDQQGAPPLNDIYRQRQQKRVK